MQVKSGVGEISFTFTDQTMGPGIGLHPRKTKLKIAFFNSRRCLFSPNYATVELSLPSDLFKSAIGRGFNPWLGKIPWRR